MSVGDNPEDVIGWLEGHMRDPSFVQEMIAQARRESFEAGAAEMRERAALVSDDEGRKAQDQYDGTCAHELPMPVLRHVARRIRALPLTAPLPVDETKEPGK